MKGGKRRQLCKFGKSCNRPPGSCFFVHPWDPEYDDIRRESAFAPSRRGRPSPERPMQKSPDKGWGGRRPPRDRSRSRSRERSPRRDDHRERKDVRRDDYKDRRDRPRERSFSRDPSPPRSRIPPSSSKPSSKPSSPPRQPPRSRGHDSQGGPPSIRPRPTSPTPSTSSHGAASRDKEASSASRKMSTSTSLSVSSAPVPMSPRSSNQPTSNPNAESLKFEWDSTFKRSNLGQKKADNPFKSPAAPPATGTSSTPSSSTTQPLSNVEGFKQTTTHGLSSQAQKPWKPVGGSTPPIPGNVNLPPTSQDKGKGKEKEVLPTPMEIEAAPIVETKPLMEPARTTKEEWLKKIRLLVEAVEMRARQQTIRAELNNLKRLEDRYSVNGEQNSEGRKRLAEEAGKQVAADKAAVAKLKELCFRLASGTPGDDDQDFQASYIKHEDPQRATAAAEERKNLLARLKQVQEDVHQVTKDVKETSAILANHKASVAAANARTIAHDADGDVHMDTVQPIAGPSSSMQTSQALDRSVLNEITNLKRQIELLDQGLEDARAEVEDARVTLVARVESLAEIQATRTSEAASRDHTAPVSPKENALDDDLVKRVENLSNGVAFVANYVADATDKTTGMSLKRLRDENVELRERLDALEKDRARRNGIIDQLAKRLAQVQGPPLPTEELRIELVDRTRTALRPILEDLEQKNEEAVKRAEVRLTKQLRDSLAEVGMFFSRLKNLPGDGVAGIADFHSPRSTMTDSSTH